MIGPRFNILKYRIIKAFTLIKNKQLGEVYKKTHRKINLTDAHQAWKTQIPALYKKWLLKHQTEWIRAQQEFCQQPILNVRVVILHHPKNHTKNMLKCSIKSIKQAHYAKQISHLVLDLSALSPATFKNDLKKHLSLHCFYTFIQSGDEIDVHFYKVIASSINNMPHLDTCFTDHDFIDYKKQFKQPFLKPAYSKEHLYEQQYLTPGLCIKSTTLNKQFKTHSELTHLDNPYFESYLSQSLAQLSSAPLHIPCVAVHAHIKNKTTHQKTPAFLQTPRKEQPMVSILIPFRDQLDLLKRCLYSITLKTDYPNYEIVLINNQSINSKTLKFLNTIKTHPLYRHLSVDEPFNFSRLNNLGAKIASGEILVLLNNDTEIIRSDWLSHLIYFAQQKDIGAVGARLIYHDYTIQHAGIILGVKGHAAHAFQYYPYQDPHYFNFIQTTRNVSAVTGACLAVEKKKYQEVGGLNESDYKVAYNDIDFCLRLQKQGYRCVYAAQSIVIHHESKSRKGHIDPQEDHTFKKQYTHVIAQDPYYHPLLSQHHTDYRLKS